MTSPSSRLASKDRVLPHLFDRDVGGVVVERRHPQQFPPRPPASRAGRPGSRRKSGWRRRPGGVGDDFGLRQAVEQRAVEDHGLAVVGLPDLPRHGRGSAGRRRPADSRRRLYLFAAKGGEQNGVQQASKHGWRLSCLRWLSWGPSFSGRRNDYRHARPSVQSPAIIRQSHGLRPCPKRMAVGCNGIGVRLLPHIGLGLERSDPIPSAAVDRPRTVGRPLREKVRNHSAPPPSTCLPRSRETPLQRPLQRSAVMGANDQLQEWAIRAARCRSVAATRASTSPAHEPIFNRSGAQE